MEKNDELYINKENTLAIKGIALILMFIHHFFTFPKWIISDISYPYIEPFRDALKICVPMFAFITGYIYSKSKNRGNFKYSIKKITDILIYYWFVYIIFLIINFLLGNKTTLIGIIKEILLLKTPIMFFCWYVRFYCITMIVLPLLNKFKSSKIYLDIIFLLFFPILIINILHIFFNQNQLIREMIYYFPFVTVGLIVGKYSFFNKIDKKLKNNSLIINIIICLLLILTIFLISGLNHVIIIKFFKYYFLINLDIIYIPIFIFCITYILRIIKYKALLKIIGKYSLLMWLTHCIFFNPSKKFFQPILYIFKKPILVLLWGLFLCYIMSIIFEKIIKKLLNIKNNKILQI